MNKDIPIFLEEKIKQEYPYESTQIIEGYSKQKPITLRVNTLKTTSEEIEEKLKKSKIKYTKVNWYNDAFIIETSDITKLKIYEEGKIYLQSLSAMLPALIVDPKASESILDMTSAPGGKTLQLSCLSNGKALITACEKNKIRFERLKYNIDKQKGKKISLLNEDARKLDEFFRFDKILLDAPCSGSGTINTNEKINFNEKLFNNSIKTQKELIKKAVSLLKPNGELIYSTCSILKEENEEIVKSILNEDIEIVPIDTKIFQDISLLPTTIKGTICIIPNELYEGFFIAKIRKEK